tara:strand:- start:53 stop:1198 length:1146 start_codon:yes stop_codon:yes gene_type:complete
MNITEMHIAIQQGVDKIHSLQADMLLPEEIDLEINKNIYKFISHKYNKGGNKYQKGFEESQTRIDDLRTLVVEYSDSVTYKEELRPGRVFVDSFKLPGNYLHLVNQRSDVFIQNCTPVNYVINSDNKEVAYFVLSFNEFFVNNGTYVDEVEMVQNLSVPLSATNPITIPLTAYTNYPADNITLIDEIVSGSLLDAGFEAYWEEYNGLTHPGSFIIIVDTAIHSYFNADSSVGLVTEAVGRDSLGEVVTRSSALYKELDNLEKRYIVDGEDFQRIVSANKFVQQDDIFALLSDPFNTTKYTGPLTTFREDSIDIYTSDIFIIDKVKITYLKKPAKVSLPLQIDCDLPQHTHQEIVTMAVSSMLEGIADPRYQTHQIELSKSE